jgi:acetyl esterase/lipase
MLYGRLADPDATIGTDTRADPRMVAAFVPFGLDGRFPAPELEVDAPLEDRLAFAAMAEDGTGAILDAFAQAVPRPEGVVTTTTTITGVDGNDVTLYISRPDAPDAALPCVVHLHGGAMAILTAADRIYARIREYLAATGLVVVLS